MRPSGSRRPRPVMTQRRSDDGMTIAEEYGRSAPPSRRWNSRRRLHERSAPGEGMLDRRGPVVGTGIGRRGVQERRPPRQHHSVFLFLSISIVLYLAGGGGCDIRAARRTVQAVREGRGEHDRRRTRVRRRRQYYPLARGRHAVRQPYRGDVIGIGGGGRTEPPGIVPSIFSSFFVDSPLRASVGVAEERGVALVVPAAR
mmetsp:Transcript_349/g.1026  ORF Transcript_349/g.1026 Transcript_349/m.1026 type:complete len:200 (-) Transcript_349:423-1022(-)